ncbi:MAG: ABC-type bacteriocin/lantibiotic exporter with double-glycine peptidase domain [Flavobacteriales bacterium]
MGAVVLIKSEKSRWLMSLLRKDVKLLVITFFLGGVISVLGLSSAIFSQKIIDVIIPSNDIAYLVRGIVIVGFLLLLKAVIIHIHSIIGALHGKRFNMRLIDTFFKKLLYLPKSFYDTNQTGSLIARMHDSRQIHGAISHFFNILVLNVVTVIISTSFLFYYSVPVGVVVLLAFPVFFISAYMFKGRMRERFHEEYLANGENESNYIATIQNSDLIKAHNKQDHFSKKSYQAYGNYQEKSFLATLVALRFGVTSESIGTIFYIFILAILAFQAVAGQITIGEYAATMAVAIGLLGPIGVLGNAIMHIQGGKVALDRMYEVVQAENEFHEGDEAKKVQLPEISSVEMRRVSFSYEKGLPQLIDISFSATRGELVCVYGKNGAGKSTVLNLLMGLYRAESGEIFFNGEASSELSLVALRERIAIISQQAKLFDGSLVENISLSHDEACAEETKKYLDEYGFSDFISRIKDGYEAKVFEGGGNLSGGQKQIVSLARALVKRPDMLLVDEATASLDSESENFVVDMLQQFTASGGIVIMVSHRLKPARAATKIVLLEDHRITQVGTHEELVTGDNFYASRFKDLVL